MNPVLNRRTAFDECSLDAGLWMINVLGLEMGEDAHLRLVTSGVGDCKDTVLNSARAEMVQHFRGTTTDLMQRPDARTVATSDRKSQRKLLFGETFPGIAGLNERRARFHVLIIEKHARV